MARGTCIILAGTPQSQDLSWDDGVLMSSFQTPIKRFLSGEVPAMEPWSTQMSSAQWIPKWRSVCVGSPASVEDDDAPEGRQQMQPRSVNHRGGGDVENHEHARFLEHSLALLDELDPSQIAWPGERAVTSSTISMATTTSMPSSLGGTDGSLSASSGAQVGPVPPRIHIIGDVMDLVRIPNAEYITRIHPQTMTVNILSAVSFVSPVRTVQLRKREGQMHMIELLLGDETQANFRVTWWLVPNKKQPMDDIHRTLIHLKTGDMVLIRNVALHAWNGRVHGQNLKRMFARNYTALSVVRNAQELPYCLEAKFGRLLEWRDWFVGRGGTCRMPRRSEGMHRAEENLPPDTQSPSKSS